MEKTEISPVVEIKNSFVESFQAFINRVLQGETGVLLPGEETSCTHGKSLERLGFMACNFNCDRKGCGNKFIVFSRTEINCLIVLRPLLGLEKAEYPDRFILSVFSNASLSVAEKRSGFHKDLAKTLRTWLNLDLLLPAAGPKRKLFDLQAKIGIENGLACRRDYLAGIQDCTPTWLSVCFRNKCGITLKEYVHRIRYCYALWQVTATRRLVKQIAFSCGYADPQYFGKAFKKYWGSSPESIRKKHV